MNTALKAPELLSPAGTLRNMKYAFAYGADAVYAGQPRYSLRARNNDFTLENLSIGIDYAHQHNKKFFVASNILPHDRKVETYMKDMAPVIALKPDALIMSDPGLIMMVREKWPEVPIHLSVQANTTNSAAVKFWKSVGVERIILSRELSLDEVERVRQNCPDMELEVFVHGALCIAYSGRCLLSGYMNHRDPNQGTCTNACRWKYDVKGASEDVTGDIVETPSAAVQTFTPEQKVYLLEEENRPGEKMPIFEDEHGTYIMNSKDLRAVQHVARLTEIGIDSLKIEGRTKSHYYVSKTAQTYKEAIYNALNGIDQSKDQMVALDGLANRGYTEGFFRRHVPEDYQNYEQGASQNDTQKFVGEVISYDPEQGMIEIDVKNKFRVGDHLQLMTPSGNHEFELQEMLNKNDELIEVAPGSGHVIRMSAPSVEGIEFGLLAVSL